MPKDKQTIINDIEAHIKKQGGTPSSWYTGITSDINQRLHSDHNVPPKKHWYMYRETSSDSIAREIEDYFVNTYGTDGGSGGGDEDSKYVYSYLKTSVTNP